MNDLIITTNSFTPAKVDFNYQQISDQLDGLLAKYKGLVFTEDTAKNCNKTIADLRKGKELVEDYRKKTKAKLSEDITAFENDCKSLSTKFDGVILPLTKQADVFETNRKKEKREAVQFLIDRFKKDLQLTDKFSKPLQVIESYLNKSKSMGYVREELEFIADNCKKAQDQEEHDIELITNIVAKTNESDQLTLSDTSYLRLLEFHSTGNIISQIYDDAHKMVQAREKEKAKIEQLRIKKELAEVRLLLEKQTMEDYATERQQAIEEENKLKAIELQDFLNSSKEEEKEILITVYEDEIELLPLEVIEEPITELYEIKGTKTELEALEEYLNNNVINWTTISKF